MKREAGGIKRPPPYTRRHCGNLIMTQTCLECKDPWTSPYPALYRASPKFHPRSPGYFCHDGCALAWHTRKVYGGRVPHPKGGDPCPIG